MDDGNGSTHFRDDIIKQLEGESSSRLTSNCNVEVGDSVWHSDKFSAISISVGLLVQLCKMEEVIEVT